MFKKLSFVLILCLLLLLTSCSDLFKKEVVKQGLQSTRLRVNCDLEIKDFGRILQDNISGTINCLADNLNLFMKLDETTQNGYLSRKALVQYLSKNEPDMTAQGLKIINTVFDVNYLIRGESPDLVSRENLNGIIELALVLNREASLIYDLSFGSRSPGTYATQLVQRDRINNAVSIIRTALLKIYRPDRGGQIHKINLISLLETFITNQHTLDQVHDLIFLKSTLLGGVKDELTHLELSPLIDTLPKIGQMALDIIRYKYLTLTQNEEMLLLSKDIESLEGIIFHPSLGNRDAEVFFNLREAMNGVNALLKDGNLDYDKYKNLLIEAKQIIMKGETESVSGADFKYLLSHGKNITQIGLDFNRFYFSDALHSKLESRTVLNLNPNDYTNLFPLQSENLKNFIRIANKYRFQRKSPGAATYSPDYFRHSEAMFEIGMIEYGLKLFFDRHGVASNGLGGKSMEAKDILSLVKIYEHELIDLGVFMPRKGETTANTISLLGSLFQYQSDENKLFDINEATEFIETYLSSSGLSDKMMDYFKAQNCTTDQFGRVEPTCFKEHFFNGVCGQYSENFPSMMKYLGTTADCKNLMMNEKNAAFLDMSTKAARTCNIYPNTTEEIFYSKSDVFAILLVMMHIETTILRWDINGNNLMDEDEVMNAYTIYAPAIEGMLDGKPAIFKKLKKYIYQWLVRYENVPQLKTLEDFKRIWNFIFVTPRVRPADRKTIAAILKVMSDESIKKSVAKGEPQFQCEWLRDPDHIPRDP